MCNDRRRKNYKRCENNIGLPLPAGRVEGLLITWRDRRYSLNLQAHAHAHAHTHRHVYTHTHTHTNTRVHGRIMYTPSKILFERSPRGIRAKFRLKFHCTNDENFINKHRRSSLFLWPLLLYPIITTRLSFVIYLTLVLSDFLYYTSCYVKCMLTIFYITLYIRSPL